MVAGPISNGGKPGSAATQFKRGNPGGPGRPKKSDRIAGLLAGLRLRTGTESDYDAFREVMRVAKGYQFQQLVVSLIPKQEDPDSMNVRASPEELAAAEAVWAHRLAALDPKQEAAH